MATALIISPIPNLPPIPEDFSFHPTLVPGNDLYERLRVENPKKLKKMMEEERATAKYLNDPEFLAGAYEREVQRRERRIRDHEQHGYWWHCYQEGLKSKQQMQAISDTDYGILGLDTASTYQKKDVRNAYRRKARKLHPDVGGDAESFKQLYIAYRNALKGARA
jgi:DnaJ-like protein